MTFSLIHVPYPEPEDDWRCTICSEWKPISRRSKRGIKTTGERRYKNQCNDCHNKSRKVTKGRTADAFRNKRFVDQKGMCSICARPFGTGQRAPHLDHKHNTTHRRGLICQGCNSLLGNAEDNPRTLINAALYIMDTNSQTTHENGPHT